MKSSYFIYEISLRSTDKFFTPSMPVTIAAFSFEKYIKGNPDLSDYFSPKELSLIKKPLMSPKNSNFIASRVSAKLAISSAIDCSPLGVQIKSGSFSQPIATYIGRPGISISITHSRYIGISAAFGQDYQFGIDFERIQKRLLDLQNFSDTEVSLINNSSISPEIAATIFWTAKEALSKTLLVGFTVDISIFQIKLLKETSNFFITEFVHFPRLKARSIIIGEYIFTYVMPDNLEECLNITNFQELLNNIIGI